MCLLLLRFLPLSFSLGFLTYAHSILSLLLSFSFVSYSISSFASYLCIIARYLSLPVFGCLPIHSQFLSLAVFYYSVYFYFTIIHSESVLISQSLTLSPYTYSGSISISSCLFHCLSDSVDSQSHSPKQLDVEGKGYCLRLCATGYLLPINFEFNTVMQLISFTIMAMSNSQLFESFKQQRKLIHQKCELASKLVQPSSQRLC